jgi:hypothetical protein
MNLVSARKGDNEKTIFRKDRDIFIELPSESNDARQFMDQAGAKLVTINEKNYVVGEEAVNFSSFLGEEFKRPLKSGLINPDEDDLAINILDILINGILGQPKESNETCIFCIPAEPIDEKRNVLYHEKTLEYIIKRHGFSPKAINEAQAIIYSELEKEELTGIGISWGSGMTNMCATYKAFPVFSFSVGRGGDWIDSQVSQATGKTASEITMIKETELDLSKEGENRILRYLKNYYEEHIDYVIRNIIKKFEQVKRIPPTLNAKNKNAEAIPIVLAGGTSVPKGFAELFRDRLEKSNFPFKISKVIVAQDQLYTVANGLLKYALSL